MGLIDDLLDLGGGIFGPDGTKQNRGNIPDGSTGRINGMDVKFYKPGKRWYVNGGEHDGKWIRDGSNNSGSGGCFITTAVAQALKKPDDCVELTKFRYFRDTFMQATPEMRAEIAEYYKIAPEICVKIDGKGEEKAAEKYTSIWENFLKPAFEVLESGDKQKAHDLYKNMVLELKSEFLEG
jgi:hypothetical protein